jgi:serine/threonine protein kinase
MLPTTQEYKISLMIGQDSFRTLEGVEVIPNPNYPDEPWYSTGGLAIVFKLKLKEKLYALKCFYTEANERQERLGLIAAYLKQNPSPYFVDFTYLENELWVQTDNNEGQGYPVVLMEWVEGKTLDNYLEQICTQNNTPALKNLYFQFCNLAWWLQQQPIAHGDIKHDNLIVTPEGKLKLIDYDGVFVPALRGRKANEMGSPCYQHPKRDAYFFDKNLDDFSLLVLQITLLALQHQPKLFTEHYNGDGIILKDTDYQNFAQSSIKTILWQLPEVKIPLLLSQLQGNLNNLNAIDLMPLLQDVAWINWLVAGQKDSELELERQKLKGLIMRDKKWREIFIHTISREYPVSEKLIEKYDEKWYWRNLSWNESLPWSLGLIEKYENKWNWEHLSRKVFIPWSVELIEKYEDKWKWEFFGLSENESLPWSVELIEKYENKWNWGVLSRNNSLPWSDELIEKYKDKWDWDWLTIHQSFELVKKYKDKWNWRYLSRNESLPWSIEFIEQHRDKWDWENLSGNESLPWSVKLIEKYEEKWNWSDLSRNKSLSWSFELIEKYEDKWFWGHLSSNESLPWSLGLIEKYENKWGDLSRNKSLPWSLELIEKYENKWNWGIVGLSENESLPWSIDLIEKYKYKWEWDYLIKMNNGTYEKVLQPLLDDEFIDEIMAQI